VNLHISRVRRGSTVYVYGQLVESHRRADGMPTQKVVANLGQLSEIQIENLRLALEASRRDARVFLDKRQLPSSTQFAKPTHNLRYLDLAVLRELWCGWGLDKLLDEILPGNAAELRPSDVVAALTFQRCVAPGSKLHAERWFPTTALPELLGIEPRRFNNTRLHRVLDGLEAVSPLLMQRLSGLYRTQQGEFTAMFLDITDTRFVGQGPELAEKAKTKEGRIERKIGIVLLCNERGYPVRWKVIAGKCPEPPAMHEVFGEIRGLEWVAEVPVVCDRAMGCSAELAKLLPTGVQFVTALRSNEWGAYTSDIPHACLAELQPASEASASDPCATEAARRVLEAGMQRVSSTLYILDLGVIGRDAGPQLTQPDASASEPGTAEVSQVKAGHADASRTDEAIRTDEASPADPGLPDARQALMWARQIDADQAAVGSLNAAARRLGLTAGAAKGYRRLLKLGADLQHEILEGHASGVSLARLYAIAKLLENQAQRDAFDRARSTAPEARSRRPRPVTASFSEPDELLCIRVRAVVAFNPALFVDQRRTAQKQLVDVQLWVRALNDRLARPRSRQKPRDIEAEVERMLRRRNLLEAFTIRVVEHPAPATPRYQVHAELDVAQWQRRRRRDGFSVIVAHPGIDRAAGDLCQLYRAKDAVEKDFQIIKGLVRLRPIWHHTDAKVRAHVTLCMLALLLQRTLDERLRHVSAEQAIETLATCCLNRFQDAHGKSHYVVTQPDDAQQALLRELKLAPLAEDTDVVERLRPR
jgi:hypothetical protein